MDAMTPDQFWALIEQTVPYEADTDAQTRKLRALLETLSAEDVVAFDMAYARELKRSYSWDLWGAIYVAHGGASDDSFHYFCSWLISKGKTLFETVLKAPDDLADHLADPPAGPLEFEEFAYVAGEVWSAKTGQDFADMPFDAANSLGGDPTGEEFEEDNSHLANRYPKLWARFGDTPIDEPRPASLSDDTTDEFSFDRSELDALRAGTTTFMRQRLVMWALRWIIGFALIAVIVWYHPDYSWLWWVGAIVALLSLAILLIGQRVLARKFDQTDHRIDKAESEIRSLDDDTKPDK